MVLSREEALYRAAQMYYVNDEKMDAIASSLGVSRSTVSRMLKEARESGTVRITLTPHASSISKLSQELADVFGVAVHVAMVRRALSDQRRRDAVARVAARLLEEWVQPGSTVGVAWGTTVSAVATQLQPQPVADVHIVQLNGAANSSTTGIPYASTIIARLADAFGAESTFFPVPAFFDYAATREAMWQERSVQRVLHMQQRCDLALFGVGGLSSGSDSHVYQAGYVAPEDLAELTTQGAVGDVCTVLLREDGSYADIALNSRATGPTPRELARIPRRLCAAVGDSRVPAIIGALRAGVATDLVIDEITAGTILKRVTARPAR
ncbi:MAG: transcriptional regulator [Ruaniaceae bacterium]|nr:transcriptional regulator [Ruaniaceae bacterium]